MTSSSLVITSRASAPSAFVVSWTLVADEALATAMEAGVRSQVILAMGGSTRAVQAAYGLSTDPQADLAAAEQLAREALAVDPGRAHAHTVLGTVALIRHQWDLARKHAADAAAASPFHPTFLATAGTLMANAGDWEQGVALLRESLRLNPLHPGYMHTLLAQDRIMLDDDAAALDEVLALDPTFLDDPVATFTRYTNLIDEQIGALLRHLEPLRPAASS